MTNLAEPRRTSPDTSPGRGSQMLVGTSPPLLTRRGGSGEVCEGVTGALKRSEKLEDDPARFACVKCGVEVPPTDLLCRACYEARRPPVCPICGGRLAGGKCGWC